MARRAIGCVLSAHAANRPIEPTPGKDYLCGHRGTTGASRVTSVYNGRVSNRFPKSALSAPAISEGLPNSVRYQPRKRGKGLARLALFARRVFSELPCVCDTLSADRGRPLSLAVVILPSLYAAHTPCRGRRLGSPSNIAPTHLRKSGSSPTLCHYSAGATWRPRALIVCNRSGVAGAFP